MKRSGLRRTSALDRSSRSLERRTPLKRGEGLKRTNGKPVAGTGVHRAPISPASRSQRLKVAAEGKCRVCGIPGTVTVLDPAHICDRSLGGCGDPLCVCTLCRAVCHRRYDEGELDLLPFLTREEQAHAVLHLGVVGALRRITNDRAAAS